MNRFLTLIGISVIAAGGWYAYQNLASTSGDPDTYPYICENSTRFSLAPAEDFSWVAIFPGENATFSQQTLSFRDSVNGMHYMGADVEIVGTGETLVLGLSSGTSSCAAAPESKPIRWDATTRIEENLALTVASGLVGTWHGTGETKFSREFKADGTYIDTYPGGATARGLWFAFTPKNAPQVSFPLEDNHVYLQLAAGGDVAYLTISTMTLSDLHLVYMDRPGILTFRLAP